MVCPLYLPPQNNHVIICIQWSSNLYSSTGAVCVCLGPEASVQDEIRVMCQALWLRRMLSSQPSRGASAEQRMPLWLLISVHQQRSFFFSTLHFFLL